MQLRPTPVHTGPTPVQTSPNTSPGGSPAHTTLRGWGLRRRPSRRPLPAAAALPARSRLCTARCLAGGAGEGLVQVGLSQARGGGGGAAPTPRPASPDA